MVEAAEESQTKQRRYSFPLLDQSRVNDSTPMSKNKKEIVGTVVGLPDDRHREQCHFGMAAETVS